MIPDGIAPIEEGIFHIRIVIEFHVKPFILKARRVLHFQQIYGRASRVNTVIPDRIILGISYMTELEYWQRVTTAPIAEICDSLNEAHQKSDSRTSKSAAVFTVKSTFHERERWLDFHDAELGDAATLFDGHVTGGIHGHFPPIIRTAVARIHHAYRIYL